MTRSRTESRTKCDSESHTRAVTRSRRKRHIFARTGARTPTAPSQQGRRVSAGRSALRPGPPRARALGPSLAARARRSESRASVRVPEHRCSDSVAQTRQSESRTGPGPALMANAPGTMSRTAPARALCDSDTAAVRLEPARRPSGPDRPGADSGHSESAAEQPLACGLRRGRRPSPLQAGARRAAAVPSEPRPGRSDSDWGARPEPGAAAAAPPELRRRPRPPSVLAPAASSPNQTMPWPV